jgi:hypothetical protein
MPEELGTLMPTIEQQYDVLQKRIKDLTVKERSNILKYAAGYMEADKNEPFLKAMDRALAMFGKELET